MAFVCKCFCIVHMYLNYIKIKLIFEKIKFPPRSLGKVYLSLSLKTKKNKNFSVFYIYRKVYSYTNAKKNRYRNRTVLFIWKYFFICESFIF